MCSLLEAPQADRAPADTILAIQSRLEKTDIDPAKAEEQSAISRALAALKKLEEERLGEPSGG